MHGNKMSCKNSDWDSEKLWYDVQDASTTCPPWQTVCSCLEVPSVDWTLWKVNPSFHLLNLQPLKLDMQLQAAVWMCESLSVALTARKVLFKSKSFHHSDKNDLHSRSSYFVVLKHWTEWGLWPWDMRWWFQSRTNEPINRLADGQKISEVSFVYLSYHNRWFSLPTRITWRRSHLEHRELAA